MVITYKFCIYNAYYATYRLDHTLKERNVIHAFEIKTNG